jgi:gluconate 5-dehydrogenase
VIINIASIAGLKGAMPSGVHYSAYVASKGGLLALTRELAAKWAQYNIRVNAISPGFFPSRMTEKVIEDKGEAEMAKGIPMQRLGRAGELKGVALFLAASASGYITGQNVVVDGGRTAV